MPGPLSFPLKPHIASVGTSATLEINERCQALIRDGRKVIRFGFGQSPFPVPAAVIETLRAHAHEKAYLPVKGLPELRTAAAAFLSKTRQIDVEADQILIGPGSKELIYLLQVCLQGTLYLPTPSWVSYAPQSVMTGNACRWIRCSPEDHWKLTPDALDQAVTAPGFLILNYPNNPSGMVYTDQELEALAAVAREKQLIVIADEIYNMLRFDGQVTSLAAYYPEGTIITSGLSKWCGAGGWRLGVAAFPRDASELLEQMAILASETFTAVNAPLQFAAVTAYADTHDLADYRTRSRQVLSHIARYVHGQLTSCGVGCIPAGGGFYVFPDMSGHAETLRHRGILTSDALCMQLLEETGVAFLPGTVFGCPPEVLTARLAFVDFDGEHALLDPPDMDTDESWIEHHTPDIVTGLAKFCTWLAED